MYVFDISQIYSAHSQICILQNYWNSDVTRQMYVMSVTPVLHIYIHRRCINLKNFPVSANLSQIFK